MSESMRKVGKSTGNTRPVNRRRLPDGFGMVARGKF